MHKQEKKWNRIGCRLFAIKGCERRGREREREREKREGERKERVRERDLSLRGI